MKKGQTKISFGMIFSIILIVIFLAFAFYGIRWFLGFQESTQANLFFDDLERDIRRISGTTGALDKFDYNIPRKVDEVCFGNFSKLSFDEKGLWQASRHNVAFLPYGEIEPSSKNIERLDIGKTLDVAEELEEDVYTCIPVEGGRLSIVIESERFNAFVKAP